MPKSSQEPRVTLQDTWIKRQAGAMGPARRAGCKLCSSSKKLRKQHIQSSQCQRTEKSYHQLRREAYPPIIIALARLVPPSRPSSSRAPPCM